jgi:hypothetical protein
MTTISNSVGHRRRAVALLIWHLAATIALLLLVSALEAADAGVMFSVVVGVLLHAALDPFLDHLLEMAELDDQISTDQEGDR